MPEWIHTLTIDASYDRVTRTSGVGIVVQAPTGGSGRGPIIDRIAEAHVGLPPGLGEMFAVLRALEIASDRGFTRIRIRSDYNSMRRMLRECFRSGAQGRDDLQQRIPIWPRGSSGSILVMSRDVKINLHICLLDGGDS